MYKYEIHAHTSETSLCGKVKAKEAVRLYHDKGYQGIIFTDHFHHQYFDSLEEISWKEKIKKYHLGLRYGIEEGKKYDMDILWGIELRFPANNNDFLIYGVDDDFLVNHEDILNSSIEEFHELVKNRKDILTIQAHPNRKGCTIVDYNLVDGYEVCNRNPRHKSYDYETLCYEKEHNMLHTSSSDFHCKVDLAQGGILTDSRLRNNTEVLLAIRNLRYEDLIGLEYIKPEEKNC
jgi:histidinol phosphatase-like PHP family hydrolase